MTTHATRQSIRSSVRYVFSLSIPDCLELADYWFSLYRLCPWSKSRNEYKKIGFLYLNRVCDLEQGIEI